MLHVLCPMTVLQSLALNANKHVILSGVDALFGEALLAIGKKKSTNQQEGKMAAKGRDADNDSKQKSSKAMKMMFQMDAREMDAVLREDVSTFTVLLVSHLLDLEEMTLLKIAWTCSPTMSPRWRIRLKWSARKK